MRNLADVIAYNKAHAAEAMPFFQQETLIKAEATDGLNTPKYLAAVRKTVTGARQAIDGLLKTNQLTAIVGAPAATPASPPPEPLVPVPNATPNN